MNRKIPGESGNLMPMLDVSATMPPAYLFGRFEVRSELGQGGFGRVMRAFDRVTQTEVAVKELHRFGPDALLRFKKEFRALADVEHPNLVRIGELFESEGRWGFSMELVPGTDLLSWVRPVGHSNGFDEVRLRAAIAGLASGIAALHALGLLHRDVKPTNVRVTPEGRVVLLDFGLVTHLQGGIQTSHGAGGTAAYMAPEQASADSAGPAADWYALGVLLYEALTGELPFVGSPLQVLLDKHRAEPISPNLRSDRVPADLSQLCMALLGREPSTRPSHTEVLEVSGRSERFPTRPPSVQPSTPATSEWFVGREAECAAVTESFAQARAGGLRMALIEGVSGVGKTTLARYAVDQERRKDDTLLVLKGRCHAAEQVPYKAFDGVVDELAAALGDFSSTSVKMVLPLDAGLLPLLFPVLMRVPLIRDAYLTRVRRDEIIERHVLFTVFLELMARIAEHRPLLIFIDDLQWSDEDSLRLLVTALEAPRGPRALILATARALDAAEGPVADQLRALATRERVDRLVLSELAQSEAIALSAHLLDTVVDDPRAAQLAMFAARNPFFIGELASQALESPRETPIVDLENALRARAARLGVASRGVLELLAVSAAPTPIAILGMALRAHGEELARATQSLRVARLALVVRRGDLACYHDRVREAVFAGLEPSARVALHHRLAIAWEGHESVDPMRAAQHWLGAEQPARAVPWLERAAEQALASAAFERAADLFQTILDVGDGEVIAEHGHRLRLALADALDAAGRCAHSARVLLSAVQEAGPDERVELERRAAQQLLRAADMQGGLAASQRALEAVGIGWPRGTVGVLTRLLLQRLQLRLRGLAPGEGGAVDSAVDVRQLDTLWRLAQPLGYADVFRAAELCARHLRLSLVRQDARHVGFGLCADAMLVAMQAPEADRVRTLYEAAEGWVLRDGSADLRAYHLFALGQRGICAGDYDTALPRLEEAHTLYLTQCPSEAWHISNVRGLLLTTRFWRGEFARFASSGEAWISHARARGDRFGVTVCCALGSGVLRHLMADDPTAARAELDDSMDPWRADGFGLFHLGEVHARHFVHAYSGGHAAHDYMSSTWPRIRGAFLMRMRVMAELICAYRVDAALRAWVDADEAERPARLREADEAARELRKAGTAMGRGFRALFSAQLALMRGKKAQAKAHALEALERWTRIGTLYRRLCPLLLDYIEDRDPAPREAELLAWLESEGWQQPSKALAMWLPVYAWLGSVRVDITGV